MYERLVRDLKTQYPHIPEEPTLHLGLGIKHIRLRMGLTQDQLAQAASIKASALKTLENGYAKFTTTSNLEAIARALHVVLPDMILETREWSPGNFFVLKLNQETSEKTGKQKLGTEVSFKRKLLSYENFQVDFVSPPITAPSHFCFALLDIKPGKTIAALKLPYPNQIAGFVQRGSLRVIYNSKEEHDVFGNQSFLLRGDKSHDFINLDKDNPLKLSLTFSLTPSRTIGEVAKAKSRAANLSIGRAIHAIRNLYSDSRTRSLSFPELSYLTGLEEKSLRYLEQTTSPKQVIYWDKIEKITRALKIPFTRFLDLAEGKDEGYFHIATAHDRALIDYRHYLGVRMKSVLLPSVTNAFHISETYIDPKGGIKRVSWKRTDEAMVSAYVEDGELLVEVGKNRKALLAQGESVYFDGRLGYMFTNPSPKPSKLLVATHPAIIF